jgi:hypothetical protein
MITIGQELIDVFQTAAKNKLLQRMADDAATVAPHRLWSLDEPGMVGRLSDVLMQAEAFGLDLYLGQENRTILWYFLEFGDDFGSTPRTKWAPDVLEDLGSTDKNRLANLSRALVHNVAREPEPYHGLFADDLAEVHRALASLGSAGPDGGRICSMIRGLEFLRRLLPGVIDAVAAYLRSRDAEQPAGQMKSLNDLTRLLARWRAGA